jgi:hypothetical protein
VSQTQRLTEAGYESGGGGASEEENMSIDEISSAAEAKKRSCSLLKCIPVFFVFTQTSE